MSKRLSPEVKKANKAERIRKLEEARVERAKKLEALIKKHGSAYAASMVLKITPSAFYDRMSSAGVKAEGYDLLPGEPRDFSKKKQWLKGLLEKHTGAEIAKKFNRSLSAIHDRMQRYGLRSPRRFNDGDTPQERKAWLKRLIKRYGSGYKVAQHLDITPSAVYERMERCGIKRLSSTEKAAW